MDASHQTLAELLSQACLIGATIEYAEIVRRRAVMRGELAAIAALQEAGLRGLVRLFAESESNDVQPRTRMTRFAAARRRLSRPSPTG